MLQYSIQNAKSIEKETMKFVADPKKGTNDFVVTKLFIETDEHGKIEIAIFSDDYLKIQQDAF